MNACMHAYRRYITLNGVALHSVPFRYIALHYSTLHYLTLRCIALYTTVHYITVHTIAYHCIHTIPYYSILYHTIPYHTIPYHTIPYHTIPYHTIPYHIIRTYKYAVYICKRIYICIHLYRYTHTMCVQKYIIYICICIYGERERRFQISRFITRQSSCVQRRILVVPKELVGASMPGTKARPPRRRPRGVSCETPALLWWLSNLWSPFGSPKC